MYFHILRISKTASRKALHLKSPLTRLLLLTYKDIVTSGRRFENKAILIYVRVMSRQNYPDKYLNNLACYFSSVEYTVVKLS